MAAVDTKQSTKIEDDGPCRPRYRTEFVAKGVGDLGKGGGNNSSDESEIPVNLDREEVDLLKMFPDHIVNPDSDGEYGLDENSEFDKELWSKYYHQIKESEGFDIDYDVYPGNCAMAYFIPMPYFKESPDLVKNLEALADLALQFFNTKNDSKFELLEIEKVVRMQWYYHLTFKAKDAEKADADTAAAVRTFQAKMYVGFRGPAVMLCRIKNSKIKDAEKADADTDAVVQTFQAKMFDDFRGPAVMQDLELMYISPKCQPC